MATGASKDLAGARTALRELLRAQRGTTPICVDANAVLLGSQRERALELDDSASRSCRGCIMAALIPPGFAGGGHMQVTKTSAAADSSGGVASVETTGAGKYHACKPSKAVATRGVTSSATSYGGEPRCATAAPARLPPRNRGGGSAAPGPTTQAAPSGALAELKALRELNGLSASARGPGAFYNAGAADLHALYWADLSSVEPQAP